MVGKVEGDKSIGSSATQSPAKSKSKEVQSGQLAHAICNMTETLASYKVLPFACYMIVENTDLKYDDLSSRSQLLIEAFEILNIYFASTFGTSPVQALSTDIQKDYPIFEEH